MPTQQEEQQAAEFLKRAEIRTMHKDLRSLREFDALRERDKIAKIKTLEEQLQERKKANEAAIAKAQLQQAQAIKREEILTRGEKEERLAEKDLKNYATEEERQQIFLFESQRLNLERQIDSIDKEKDPSLRLEKNQLLITKKQEEERLNALLDQERKLGDQQSTIAEKEKVASMPAEKKSLEQSRWDLEAKIQEVEKKRWSQEKTIQDVQNKISQLDKLIEQLIIDKNDLRNKVLGIGSSLREIYSGIMAREEDKRRGLSEEQKIQKEALAKVQEQRKEQVQRQQWSKPAPSTKTAPESFKERLARTAQLEQEQRKKFLQDIAGDQINQPKDVLETGLPPVPKKNI
jgi:hypothetical protein